MAAGQRGRLIVISILLAAFLFTSCPNPGDEVPVDYGSGSSTIEFDFDPGTPGFDLSWTLQWEGKTTGADLLIKAAAANSNLFINFGAAMGGVLYGAALDSDGDAVAPVWGTDPDKPEFIDPEDTYRYGWFGTDGGNSEFNGYWGYVTAEAEADPAPSQVGMAGRILTDGCLDRWEFIQF